MSESVDRLRSLAARLSLLAKRPSTNVAGSDRGGESPENKTIEGQSTKSKNDQTRA